MKMRNPFKKSKAKDVMTAEERAKVYKRGADQFAWIAVPVVFAVAFIAQYNGIVF